MRFAPFTRLVIKNTKLKLYNIYYNKYLYYIFTIVICYYWKYYCKLNRIIYKIYKH